jgi:hypothetical protein
MVTILAGLATFERHLIRARTDEGRRRAQATALLVLPVVDAAALIIELEVRAIDAGGTILPACRQGE